jgi:CRISPR-associated protein Cas2
MRNVSLYIAAYDVRHPRRLARLLKILKEYATGGQKSVFECFLAPGDRKELLQRVQKEIEEDEDSFILLRLDPRAKCLAFGVAEVPQWPDYFVVD